MKAVASLSYYATVRTSNRPAEIYHQISNVKEQITEVKNMPDYTFFICKLNFDEGAKLSAEIVIDIKGASMNTGASIDAFPRKPNCYDNQLWTLVQSALHTGGGGWFYAFQSKSSGHVIGIKGTSKEQGEPGAFLETQKANGDDSQLWEFSLVETDKDGYEWYYLQSKLNGYVIGTQGDLHPQGSCSP